MSTAPSSRYIEVKGLNLHHLDWGQPDAPAMVLLHGIRLHAHCWNDFSRRFAGRFRVLALDARGHGDSAWSENGDYHLEDYYEDLRSVLEARSLSDVILIGHSLGARTAMLYAHLHPERVRKLVLVDMGAGLPMAIGKQDFSRVTETPPPQNFASKEEAANYLGNILRQAPREMIAESAHHGLRRQKNGRYVWKYDPRLGGPPTPGKREWDLWEAVKTIGCSTLLLHGELSKVVSPEIAQRMAKTMADCTVEQIPAAGHALFTDQPLAFAQSVGNFLGEEV